MLIGRFFRDFRFRSFFIEDELVCRVLVLFFRVSVSGWISLSIDEGVLKLTHENSEPMLLNVNDIDDEFAYPVQTATELDEYVGKKIINVYEYRVNGIEDGSVGAYFECENEGFSILEIDGCLFISDGKYEGVKEKLFLSRLEV